MFPKFITKRHSSAIQACVSCCPTFCTGFLLFLHLQPWALFKYFNKDFRTVICILCVSSWIFCHQIRTHLGFLMNATSQIDIDSLCCCVVGIAALLVHTRCCCFRCKLTFFVSLQLVCIVSYSWPFFVGLTVGSKHLIIHSHILSFVHLF